MKFIDWFNTKLMVNRYPTPDDIGKSPYDYIINVSDEYIVSCHEVAIDVKKNYFWFPMNESNGEIGLTSLYGALQILFIAEHNQATVLIHCHSGSNRSATVADAYYFLRTKEYRSQLDVLPDGVIELRTDDKKDFRLRRNRLKYNIEEGHLLAKNRMEKFLKMSEFYFKNYTIASGGKLDKCKDGAGL